MKSWCQKTVEKLEAKKRDGYPLTEDEAEAYGYAKNVLQNDEEYYGSDRWLEDGYEAGYINN